MKNLEKLFPISIRPYDNGSFVTNPPFAQRIWNRIRKDETWYAVGGVILNEKKVEIHVYGMADFVVGGIGILTNKIIVENPSPSEVKLIKDEIIRECHVRAIEEFERRKEDAETAEILKIREELFGM